MYTFAPTPSWTDLSYGLMAGIRTTSASVAPWAEHRDRTVWFSNGTHILKHVVKSWRQKNAYRKPHIWLPDYFCNTATQLIRKQDTLITFYPISSMFDPDWKACEAMFEQNIVPDIFVLVHYFGRIANVSLASTFCNKTRAFLLEDAAHALFAYGQIGEHGDAVFYCPHKVLAAPDGAILYGSTATVSPILKSKPSSITWLLKRAAQKVLPDSILRHRIRGLPDFSTDLTTAKKAVETAPSSLGHIMIGRYISHLEKLAVLRKQAATNWREAFLPHSETCEAALSVDEEGPAPYRFVLKFKNQRMAADSFAAFRSEGIAVETWPDLAPEVQENSARHAVACRLRQTLLFFPVFNALPLTLPKLVNRCMTQTLKY